MTQNASDIAQLTLYLAIGIVAGAALAPRLIPLEHLRRTRYPAYSMGLLIIGLSFTDMVWPARCCLFLIGATGGIMIVPINAALQEIGKLSIGSGGAVAMQNFFQNAAMLLSVGLYTLAASQHIGPILALLMLGALLISATLLLMLHLPESAANASSLE